MHSKNLVFKTPFWILAWVVGFTLFCLGMGIFFARTNGLDQWTWLCLGLTLFGIAGTVDSLISRVILSENSLTIISWKGRFSLPRGDIESVKTEKGCPMNIKTRDGHWVKIPEIIAVEAATLRKWAGETP